MKEMPIMLPSRNEVLGFAARTRTNLKCIESAFDDGADVHVVTQLALSLLGLIVFPWEKNFAQKVTSLSLDCLVNQGWPQWEISIGACDTLGRLIKHLRNAVAHGRVRFSSDSRNIEEVAIDFADCNPGEDRPNWRARIQAKDLRDFCLRFIDLLENTVD